MKYLLPFIFLPLGACSPVQPINTEIPQKNIETHPAINTQDATATIHISRKESYFASATYYWISLDDNTVMALRSGDYTAFRIKPGKYQLAVDCYGDDAWHSKFEIVTIQTGGKLFIEVEPALSEYCRIFSLEEGGFLKDYSNPANVEFGVVPAPER